MTDEEFDPEDGEFDDSEDGQPLEFYISNSDDKIAIDFGKPITWCVFNVEEAENLVKLIQKRIEAIKHKGLKYGTDTVQ